MKSITIKSVFILLVMLYMQNTWAGPTFFAAVITHEKAGVVMNTDITAPSYHACEIQKGIEISNLASNGHTILNTTNCTSIRFRLPELIMPEWKPRWPIPPVCLSCPPWDLRVLEILDPYLAKQVHELSQKYRVDEYMKELRNLQEQFDLQGFDKALEKLDTQQEQFR